MLKNKTLHIKMTDDRKQQALLPEPDAEPIDVNEIAQTVTDGVVSIIFAYMASDVVRKVLISHLAK